MARNATGSASARRRGSGRNALKSGSSWKAAASTRAASGSRPWGRSTTVVPMTDPIPPEILRSAPGHHPRTAKGSALRPQTARCSAGDGPHGSAGACLSRRLYGDLPGCFPPVRGSDARPDSAPAPDVTADWVMDPLRERHVLAEAQEMVQVGGLQFYVPSGRLWWSDQVYRICGLVPRESSARYEAFLAAVHPDDRPVLERGVVAAALAGT